MKITCNKNTLCSKFLINTIRSKTTIEIIFANRFATFSNLMLRIINIESCLNFIVQKLTRAIKLILFIL